MNNREYLSTLSNKALAEWFCVEIAKDGWFCDRCPFSEYCNGSKSGIEEFLEKERRED